jgi:CRISPR-associated endoribonuclease Cas6
MVLHLKTDGENRLTANYNYPLSAAIYKLLHFGSPEFSSFLHDSGYRLNSKTYKLFTFALILNDYKFKDGSVHLNSPLTDLIVSSPIVDEFINNLLIGTFEEQEIEIIGDGIKTVFKIESVESLPEQIIQKTNYCLLLSPVVISTKRIYNGRLLPYYFRYNDDPTEISRILNNNLKHKYELVSGHSSDNKEIQFSWDKEYIQIAESRGKRLTRKQTIKSGSKEQTDIIGNLLPFTISGDDELIKVGLETGFGEKNSMGFGLAELVR